MNIFQYYLGLLSGDNFSPHFIYFYQAYCAVMSGIRLGLCTWESLGPDSCIVGGLLKKHLDKLRPEDIKKWIRTAHSNLSSLREGRFEDEYCVKNATYFIFSIINLGFITWDQLGTDQKEVKSFLDS